MSTQLLPFDLAAFFASLDRRLKERPDPPEGEVDEGKRDVELTMAGIDKQLVLLGLGKGDIEQPLGARVAERLKRLNDEDWSKPLSIAPGSPRLLDHVRTEVDQAAQALGR